jgi:hypothetical protein
MGFALRCKAGEAAESSESPVFIFYIPWKFYNEIACTRLIRERYGKRMGLRGRFFSGCSCSDGGVGSGDGIEGIPCLESLARRHD